MIGYLLRRAASTLPTILGITLVTFFLVELLPGREFALSGAGPEARAMSPAALAQLRARYHLEDPLPLRYGGWLVDFLRWDFGTSLLDGRPVGQVVAAAAWRTGLLNLLALSLALAISVPLGMRWARVGGAGEERAGSLVLYLLYAFPTFAAAVILQHLFAVRLGILPLQGLTSLPESEPLARRALDLGRHLLLPVICLSYGSLAYLTRFTRWNLAEAMTGPALAAARARGVREETLSRRHALRLALPPLLALIGALIPALLAGSVLVETIFSVPGIGRLYFHALANRDYPVVLGLAALASLITLFGSLAAELLCLFADPRLREISPDAASR
jgi:peptide/nickel transport system permease protein